MNSWITIHIILMIISGFLIINYIINGGIFFLLLNVFTFIGNSIILYSELNDALQKDGE